MVCDMAASELPAGVSPNCQDVVFSESSVRTRPGLGAPIGLLAGNVVNYLKTYITAAGTLRAMAFTDLANLYKETNPLAFSLIGNLLDGVPASGVPPYVNSTTIFGREFLAVSDGKYGCGIPRQFDDTNLDRVSQVGAGVAPTVADENAAAQTIAASAGGATQPAAATIAASPNGATQAGFVATFTTTGAHGFAVGNSVVVSGVGVTGYNGTWQVASVPSSTTFTAYLLTSGLAASGAGSVGLSTATITTTAPHGFSVNQLVNITGVGVAGYNGTFSIASVPSNTTFTYNAGVAGLAGSGGGTATAAGSIQQGTHKVSVVFVTRQQAFLAPAPPSTWAAGGGKRAVVSGIATGPPNVIQRILIFTPAGGSSFFYITPQGTTLFSGSTVINDNVTTQVTVDFSDAILLAGVNADNLFQLQELGEIAGCIDFSNRLITWGERNKVFNFNNLTFDGGFTGNAPNGWTVDGTFGPGGGSALAGGLPAIWGDAYSIAGNGATATRGLITQSAYQDANGIPIILPNTGYSVRARVARNGLLAQGTLHIHLTSVSQGIDQGLDVAAGQAGLAYQEFTAVLTAGITTPPSDLVIRVYADGTPTQNGAFVVDNIEPYPTSVPFVTSTARASRANQPEAFDGVLGLLSVAAQNGEAIRAAFKLRENRLYFVKERSLHVTADNGQEPSAGGASSWSITEVSKTVGTPSVRGVGVGEDWVVIAHRTGLYIFWGTEPQKISQEMGHSDQNLTLAWDQINWQYGHTLWVTVDTLEKRILVGAPFGAATSPNAILQMDYRDIDPEEGATGAQAIAASPPISISFRGIKIVKDKSRKWSPWTPSVNSCALIERPDGRAHLWMGAGTGVPAPDKGAIYDVQRANLTDYSTAAQIPAYYWISFIPSREQNQVAQTHEHRKYFPYLTLFAEGSGLVNLAAAPNQFGTFMKQALPSMFLSSPGLFDLECPIDVEAERVAFKVSASTLTGAGGAWFRLQKFTPSMKGAPFAPVRGSN